MVVMWIAYGVRQIFSTGQLDNKRYFLMMFHVNLFLHIVFYKFLLVNMIVMMGVFDFLCSCMCGDKLKKVGSEAFVATQRANCSL